MSSDVVVQPCVVDDETIEHVIEPESVEELIDVLAGPLRVERHFLISGGGTRLTYGNVGGPFDAVLSTRRLNRILQYEPDDMTIAVEPGCTIAQIQEALRPANQSLALDVAHPGRATIGGSFATGTSGPRRIANGSLKDWVIGIEAVGPAGVVAKAGGMVVKNVTGYDMMHVHYGALGAFGVITRLNLKVFPAPSTSRALQFRYSSVDAAFAAGTTILASQLQPSSVLVSSEPDAEIWQLDIRCDAPATAIDGLVARVTELVHGAAKAVGVSTSDDGASATLAFTDITDLSSSFSVVRLAVTASRQRDLLVSLDEGRHAQVCADLGSGLIYLRADWPTFEEMFGRSHPGDATLLAAPPAIKRQRDVFGALPSPAAEVVRRMKDAFDPDRRFNRGRFVLGL